MLHSLLCLSKHIWCGWMELSSLERKDESASICKAFSFLLLEIILRPRTGDAVPTFEYWHIPEALVSYLALSPPWRSLLTWNKNTVSQLGQNTGKFCSVMSRLQVFFLDRARQGGEGRAEGKGCSFHSLWLSSDQQAYVLSTAGWVSHSRVSLSMCFMPCTLGSQRMLGIPFSLMRLACLDWNFPFGN